MTVLELRDAFSFGPMSLFDWLAALAAGIADFAGFAWFEAYKLRARVSTYALSG